MSSQDDVAEEDEKDVIEWSKEIEDRTLAVLEGDLEKDPETRLNRDELDGSEGVAKTNTEKYVQILITSLSLGKVLSSLLLNVRAV